ncbi:MAG: pyrroloquinoline quinone biosynthesis protein PqqB [Paracoccaceae bacterium]|jgi:pyrroloquinoline quinone biosynthesis protein B|nr:pyrroloquinoline quinone biosynthesis protein PqqB [Paracoccaceae bacterium]MDG1372510.1 pyrroloquinoline quinone biosynthesis protein PqqB [Paracoccaceae bacterium]MDG1971134.1 pyrroloquinoline quinone biosynthesis protein PqqB [Paracoccaceae bacterium]
MSELKILILGSAAGGGLPQWNCGCPNCVKARAGEIPSRSQSSIAVSANGADWAIINASPDIRYQIAACPQLHPTGPRISPIKSVFVTNGDIDHIAGLLTVRERQPFTLFSTSEIGKVLTENRIFDAVNREVVPRETVTLGAPFELAPGVTAEPFSVPGKVPLFMEGETVDTELEGEQTIGVALSAGGATAYYIPGCAKLTPTLEERLQGAEMVIFDGTVWLNDEMARQGVGQKTGARMGHMSMAGEQGSIAAFAPLNVKRKVFVHMNNTNSVLDPTTPERTEVEAAGWLIAEDGMELTL